MADWRHPGTAPTRGSARALGAVVERCGQRDVTARCAGGQNVDAAPRSRTSANATRLVTLRAS